MLTARENIKRRYWWIAVFVPIVAIVFLVSRYSVRVPYWDQWEMVLMFQKHASGTLGFSDFWKQHNEHRILFPRLILYSLARITHWNVVFENFINLILGLAVFGMIFSEIRQIFLKYRAAMILSGILAAWLILSPVQWENWIWGWQIGWFLSNLAIIAVLQCLTSSNPSTKLWFFAFVGATVATYSLANGLTIWGIGFLILLLRKSNIRRTAGWLVCGTTEILLYFYNYENPENHPSTLLFLHKPLQYIRFVLSFLGSPLAYKNSHAPLAGLVVTIILLASMMYLYWYQRSQLTGPLLFWLGLAAYSVLGALLTGIGRMGFGVVASIDSRYTTVSILFVLSSFVFGMSAISSWSAEHKWTSTTSLAVMTLVAVIFVPTLFNFGYGIINLQQKHLRLLDAQSCLRSVQSSTDPCLLLLYPRKNEIWGRIEFLRSSNWERF